MKFFPSISPMLVTVSAGFAASILGCAEPVQSGGAAATPSTPGLGASGTSAKADGVGDCEPSAQTDGGPVLARRYAGPEGASLTFENGYATLQLPDGSVVEGSLQRDGTLGASYTLEVAEGSVCGTFRLSLWSSEGVVGNGDHLALTWVRPEGSVIRACGFMAAGEGGYDRVETPALMGTYEGPAGSMLEIEAGYATVRLPDGEALEGPLSRDGTLGGSYTIDVAEGMVCGTYHISLWATEGTLGDGSRLSLNWLAPQGSVVEDCAFMRAGEGQFERSACEVGATEDTPTDETDDASTTSAFTRTRIDPATGLQRGAHPEKYTVQWNDDSGTEGTVYRTSNFASGEPEAVSCGRVTRARSGLWFEGECGLAAGFARSGDESTVVYELHQLIDFTEAGFTVTDVDPTTGLMLGAHPQKFVVAWNDEARTEGEVYFTVHFATGEPEETPCGTVRVDGHDAYFAGSCGLADLYTHEYSDEAAPFEAHELIHL
jgi:hypothetical protein